MRKAFVFLLFSFSILVMSCQKEDVFTSGELIAKELQSIIEKEKIERVINFPIGQNWSNTWIFGNYGKNYKFEGEFVSIEGETFYLNNLIKYQVNSKYIDEREVKFLLLSFY